MEFLRRLFRKSWQAGKNVPSATGPYPFDVLLNWLFANVRTDDGSLFTEENIMHRTEIEGLVVDIETIRALRCGVQDGNTLPFAQRRALARAFGVSVLFTFYSPIEGTLPELFQAELERANLSICKKCGDHMMHVRAVGRSYLCLQCDEQGRDLWRSIQEAIHNR